MGSCRELATRRLTQLKAGAAAGEQAREMTTARWYRAIAVPRRAESPAPADGIWHALPRPKCETWHGFGRHMVRLKSDPRRPHTPTGEF